MTKISNYIPFTTFHVLDRTWFGDKLKPHLTYGKCFLKCWMNERMNESTNYVDNMQVLGIQLWEESEDVVVVMTWRIQDINQVLKHALIWNNQLCVCQSRVVARIFKYSKIKKKKAQLASSISGTILCSPSLNWLYSVSSITDFRTLYPAVLFYFSGPWYGPKIFHSCSVFWMPDHLLFLNAPWVSATSYKRFHAFMDVIFLWPITKRGLWDFYLHCFLLPSSLLLVIMWVMQFYWWRYIFLHFLCFVYHS